MDILKSLIQITAFIFSFALSSTVFAAEPIASESKNNGSGDTVSNANLANNADSSAADIVNTEKSITADYQQPLTDEQYRQQIEERRSQAQQAQLEAYKRHLERRQKFLSENNAAFNNQLPQHIQDRRNAYFKHVEDRRELMNKMREQDRKAAEERREVMRQKMHQTNAPENAPANKPAYTHVENAKKA